MLQEHKEAFFQVADKFQCWIGLRMPNELSDQYIGKGGYIAKNEHCKAKSADNPAHPFKGLVVNPELCPDAFIQPSRNQALEKWKSFAAAMPFGFSVETSGPLKGLVKYQGKSIHADFDLMYISKADAAGKMIFTTGPEAEALFAKAAPELNRLIGADMILHGPEFLWKGGVGARETECVYSFGPKKAFRQDMSSMPQGQGSMH